MTGSRTTPRWRILLVPPVSGAENMARDAALMDRARATGEYVFSVYSWDRPTLSFGRNQTARGHYDLGLIAERGIDVVRRPTGGRALLHHHEATYSVTAPVAPDESLIDTYHRINRILVRGLEQLGVTASEATAAGRTPRPDTLPCFATPTDGELVTNGAKLVGSAQVRENGSLLQHGSILIEDDQSVIAEISLGKSGTALPPAATLSAALGRVPSVEEVAAALFEALEDEERTVADPIPAEEARALPARHLPHYLNELWTWRR